ncbi:hypothetical protein FXO38_26863 [Capsicum annuum]|nr:hypothetical protein FXO38_26863 [Capsicum annuum]
MNAMFKDNGKVVFKNIEPTEIELAKLEISQKDVTEDERSTDFDDDLQDPPPKKINERSKKKQKVDSSTPVAKKTSGKTQVNIVDKHTQTRNPPPRAAKAVVMKTPVFKSIPTRQASSSKMKKGKQTIRVIFPQVCQKFKGVREEFTRIRQLVKKKFKKMVKTIEHSKQQHEDTEVEAQQMDYAGVEISPQQFSPTVDQNLDENQDGTKITDKKLDDTNLSDSQFTIPDELLPSLNAYQRENITRHPLATCEEEQSDEYFNDKKSESVVEDHFQENKENVGSNSKPDMHGEVDLGMEEQIMTTPNIQELTTDEQRDETVWPEKESADHYKKEKSTIPMMHFRIDTVEDKNWFYTMGFPDQSWTDSVAHLNEYINGFRMHAAVPWYTVEDIYISVNIKKKHHWVIAILSFSERCIFLYDSYESSGHYSVVLDVIEKLAAIISLCLQHRDFYVKKGIHVENHPRYKYKDSSDMFDVLFQESLPQQSSGSLDCGVYMVTYAECLSYGHKVLANEFDPNSLRTRYAALLWEYGTRKQDANAHSDVGAPLRPARQSRITSVTEVFDV